MMPSAFSKAPLHSLHEDNQNEEQIDFFGHVTHLSLASHDSPGGVVLFDAMASVSVLHDANSITKDTIIVSGQDDRSEV